MSGTYFTITRNTEESLRTAVLVADGIDVHALYNALLDKHQGCCFFCKENGFHVQEVRDISHGTAWPINTYDTVFILGNTGSPELNELRRMASASSPTYMLTITPDIELPPPTPEFIHHPQEGRLLIDPQTFIPSAARTIHDLYVALEGEGLIGIDLGDLMSITVQKDLYPFFADITDLTKPAEETVPATVVSTKGPLTKLNIKGLFGAMVFDGHEESCTIENIQMMLGYFYEHVVEDGNFYFSASISGESSVPLRLTGVFYC